MVSTPPPVPETPANEQFHSDRQLPERIASLGGGHGLFQTLKAARRLGAEHISAIVTVADDGGSSGRLRKEFDMIPPGDLRMALVALSVSDSARSNAATASGSRSSRASSSARVRWNGA